MCRAPRMHALHHRIFRTKLKWDDRENVSRMKEMINAYKILAGKSEGKVLTSRPRRRRSDNIQMHLHKRVWNKHTWTPLIGHWLSLSRFFQYPHRLRNYFCVSQQSHAEGFLLRCSDGSRTSFRSAVIGKQSRRYTCPP